MKKRIFGIIILIAGYLLSPLSWWNDIFINIPIAYLFSWPFSLISKSLFLPFFVIGYFLTNLAGFILMHKGAVNIKNSNKHWNKKNLIRDILISIGYMILMIILVQMGIIRPPVEYFS